MIAETTNGTNRLPRKITVITAKWASGVPASSLLSQHPSSGATSSDHATVRRVGGSDRHERGQAIAFYPSAGMRMEWITAQAVSELSLAMVTL
jgi:hypothetical protein